MIDERSANFKASPKLRDLRYTALLAGALVSTTASAEDAPSVVTSIKPIHSIASAIMEGVGEPHILIDGAASPHGFSLKPSQAFLLQGADAVFWVGPDLAPGLDKPIHSMASNAKVVELMKTSGIDHLDIREGVNFDAHDHDHGDEHNDHVTGMAIMTNMTNMTNMMIMRSMKVMTNTKNMQRKLTMKNTMITKKNGLTRSRSWRRTRP